MSTATTALHVRGRGPEEVERALEAIFAREGRPRALRLQGTFSAVLARALDPDLDASYRYLILRPPAGAAWTPLLELGNRTEGLDRALSQDLDGAPVFSAFVYGDGLSGYRLARDGAEIDRYLSDPTYLAGAGAEEGDEAEGTDTGGVAAADPEAVRGRPGRFADLLPAGTSPEDFARVVLRPGWWEERDAAENAAVAAGGASGDAEEEDLVDEADRMRCIGLALELWGPSEYPFAGELEEIANKDAGPALALAFA